MNLSSYALRNPITVYMVTIAIIVLGVISFMRLAIDLFPDITFPTVTVITTYEGASPQDVETTVTRRIEKAVSTINNVKTISSRSREGLSVVGIEFNWGTNMDVASTDVQQRINQILDHLPEGVELPTVSKFDPSQISVIILALYGAMAKGELRELAENDIEPRIMALPGVAAANVSGGNIREIKININRQRMEASGVAIDQVVNAIKAANVVVPAGNLKVGVKDFSVRTLSQYTSVKPIENIPLANRSGVIITLKDVAEVKDDFEERRVLVDVNRSPGVTISVQKQSGANTVAVSDAVLKELPRIQKDLPPGMKIGVVNDQARYIRRSIRNLQHEALLGAILAIIVILLFLRNLRSTVIISLSIPISIIFTFILIYFNKMTLNIMTLGGLALGVGRLVDDAIVVLENIDRHMRQGESPPDASLKGSTEVGMAVLASTTTTIIVFIPIAFVQGITAILFLQLAFTVAFSLIASYFVAMSLIPVLSSRFLKLHKIQDGRDKPVSLLHRLFIASQRVFDNIDEKYQQTVKWAITHRKTVVGIVILSLLISSPFALFIGSEFFPQTDEGQFFLSLRLPVGTRVEETYKVSEQIQGIIYSEVPEVASTTSRSGMARGRGGAWGGNTGPHTGNLGVMLVDASRRERHQDEIIRSLRSKFAEIPGARIFINPGGIVSRVMRFGSESPIDIEILGHDLQISSRLAREIYDIVKNTRGTTDVQISREEGLPELQINIDRDRATALGFKAQQIADTVQYAIAGKDASTFLDPVTGKEYNIKVRLQESDRQKITDLAKIFLNTPSGHQVPLANFATVEKGLSPVQIERKYQQRVVHVTANNTGRDLGSLASEIEQKIKQLDIPKGFSLRMSGAVEEKNIAFWNLTLALLLAIALVYMVLASQFGSLLDPFIVMFSVPLGAIGVVWALFLTQTLLSIISFMGIIMMVGIVVSNAILLVDYTNILRRRGVELHEAVIKAGRTRLRPILMTTLTTILALMPMALGIGEGAEAQAPLAISVIGGLLVSTALTLIFIPTLYTIFEERVKKKAETYISESED